MSKRLYRTLVLGGIVVWLQVGMYLADVLTTIDAGAQPSVFDVVLLCGLMAIGVFDAVVLLRAPTPLERAATSAASPTQ